jgi:hypothetical protein
MKFTPNNPKAKSLQAMEFCTPIGTEGVRLEGMRVFGRWQSELSPWWGNWGRNRVLLQDFVNWPDSPKEIVHFTKSYGPLDSDGVEGKDFSFSVQGWQSTQKRFRLMWESRSGKANVSTTIGGLELPYDLNFHEGKLTFFAKRLEGFLLLELITAPAERLRKCARPGCENPYFVARHLKQTYCSSVCATWAQAEWKKNWWGEKGSDWLAARKKKAKEKSSRRTRR